MNKLNNTVFGLMKMDYLRYHTNPIIILIKIVGILDFKVIRTASIDAINYKT